MNLDQRIAAIATLITEAGTAGDIDQVALCERALNGDAAALAQCERVIADADAQCDD